MNGNSSNFELPDRLPSQSIEAEKSLLGSLMLDNNFIFWGKRIAPKIPSFIKKMVREREEARQREDWKLADEIRIKIQRMGYKIEDTKEGPKIKKV